MSDLTVVATCKVCGVSLSRPKYSYCRRHLFTDEMRKKLSLAKRGRAPWNKGKTGAQVAWNKGMAGYLAGEASPHWKGGITPEVQKIRNSLEYKVWRTAVFERDNYTCQECNNRGGYLNADHIKRFADYPELRFELNNGRTLCRDCHRKTDTYGRK